MHERHLGVFPSLLSIALLVPASMRASKNLNDYPCTCTCSRFTGTAADIGGIAGSVAAISWTGPKLTPLSTASSAMNASAREAGLRTGTGQGNLQTVKAIAAVDFSIECPVNITTNPDGRFYVAQWETESEKMNLLLHDIADPDRAALCHLTTVLHDDVYVRRSTGVLKAASRDADKQMSHAAPAPVTP